MKNAIQRSFSFLFVSALSMSCAPVLENSGRDKNSSLTSISEQQNQAFLVAVPRLKVVNLPAGEVGTINIDDPNDVLFQNGRPVLDYNSWLSQGYSGILFRGQGIDVTHIKSNSYDGISVNVKRHNGIVRFENLTIHSGYFRAVTFGQGNGSKDYFPGFQVHLVNVKGVVHRPHYYFERDSKFVIRDLGSNYRVGDEITMTGGTGTQAKFRVDEIRSGGSIEMLSILSHGNYTNPPFYGIVGHPTTTNGSGTGCKMSIGARVKWLWFGYNADVFMDRVTSNAYYAAEHAAYFHGFARVGAKVINSNFEASGAEGFKVRSDTTETRWAGPNQLVHIADTNFSNWYQIWSDRGGAGIVLQSTGAHILLERLVLRGGQALNGGGGFNPVSQKSRSYAIAISSEDLSYNQEDGVAEDSPDFIGGYGNGYVHLKHIVASGKGDGQFHHNNLIRCGYNGAHDENLEPYLKCARGVLIENSSLWAKDMFVAVGNIDPGTGLLRRSNTPFLRSVAESLGIDTQFEAVTPGGLTPVSQGAQW